MSMAFSCASVRLQGRLLEVRQSYAALDIFQFLSHPMQYFD
jgi:hypothetical protein